MQPKDAIALIHSAVSGRAGTRSLRSVQAWADLGAGRGTFTRALVEILGRDSRVYAVDSDAAAVKDLESLAREAPNTFAPLVQASA